MSHASQQLARWQRLLALETAQRDETVLRRQNVERQLAAVVLEQKDLDRRRNESNRLATSAATQADVALIRSARPRLREFQAASRSTENRAQSLTNALHESIAEIEKAQKTIGVIENRIDDCTSLVRRESVRLAAD